MSDSRCVWCVWCLAHAFNIVQPPQIILQPPPIVTLPLPEVIQELPFYANLGTIADYPLLQALHYDLIDVLGDGNCGIYAVILARISKGDIPIPSRRRLHNLVLEMRWELHIVMRDHLPAVIATNNQMTMMRIFYDCA